MAGKRILVVPDAHSRPGVSNRRFKALGNFIAAKQPDIIINIGDLADMGSLSSYDKGMLQAEGRRYQKDVDSVHEAQELMYGPSESIPGYVPKRYICLGNHEDRVTRTVNQHPELEGKMSIADLYYWRFHDKVVPFLEPLIVQGIMFQHYLPSGPMGRPTSGVNHARSLIVKGLQSIVVGHSHQRDFYETTRADGSKLFGLVVGCYDEEKHAYALGTQHNWWSGLCMLNEAQKGRAEPAFYSIDYVLRKFL